MTPRVAAALAQIDDAIAAHGLSIWIGAEPTYTDRSSVAPPWLGVADAAGPDGDDKRTRAAAIALGLALGSGAQVHRAPGRQFPDEPAPRFCFAVTGAPITDVAAADADEIRTLAAQAPGAPAPSDALTVTPDPGVVEINTAPCASLTAFARQLAAIDRAATAAGLSPLRYRYHGDEVDSGGGGQLTVGGPTPMTSPFVVHPATLPRLLRYLHNHPSLSYWFLGECAGSASQSPRPDEGVRERADELPLACAELEHLAALGPVDPELVWRTVAPILVDGSGNPHRAELNVEKLWNPHGGARGRLGLVEWRAFRMAPTVDAMAAAAALVCALVARCARAPYQAPWHDWGSALHHRWALPSVLAADLDDVLADLATHGYDLTALAPELASYRGAPLVEVPVHPRLAITIARAVEFWPLYGDVASQERAGARTVDPSSERFELTITTDADAAPPRVIVAGRGVALAAWTPGQYRLGIRRRQYVPAPGFVPSVPADEPLAITVGDDDGAATVRLYAWRPAGGGYDGLPRDAADAAARRAERITIQRLPATPSWPPRVITATDTIDVRAWREEHS